MWLWKHEDITYVNIKLGWTEGRHWHAPSEAPVFEINKTGEYDGKFDGDLLAISLKPASEKYPYDQVQMRFIDEENKLYAVSVWFNSALDNLINCFIWGVKSESDFKKINLSLYKQGDFAAIWVRKDWAQMQRGFDPVTTYNTLKEKKRLNGKDVTDREKLDAFLKEKVLEINTYLKELNNNEDDFVEENEVVKEVETEWVFWEEEDTSVGEKLREKADKWDDNWDLPF